MKKGLLLVLLVSISVFISSHDMFLIMDSYILEPETDYTLSLYNGTFQKSENAVVFDRMVDMTAIGPEELIMNQDISKWKEDGNKMIFDFKTKRSGTYVIGLSTKPKMIELSSTDFDEYLEHDGVMDVLEARKANPSPDAVNEKYSKHVKALIQVGGRISDSHENSIGYPAEFVLENNPYDLKIGKTLDVQLLSNNEPVEEYLVYAGYMYKGIMHTDIFKERTGKKGKFKVPIESPGLWYLRTIIMKESDEDGVDYESNWATLTFEIAEPK